MVPRRTRTTRSQAIENKASSNHEATSPPQIQQQQVSAASMLQSVPSAQPQTDVVSQLSGVQLNIQQALQVLVQSQRIPIAAPTVTVPRSP